MTNDRRRGVGKGGIDREPENINLTEPSVYYGTLGKAACGEIGAALIDSCRPAAVRRSKRSADRAAS